MFMPWLCLDSTEVINSQRVLTYLKGCLCGPWEIYGPVGFDADDPRGLDCYCSSIAEDTYVSPATDPAPWYTAGRAESGDFIGIWSEVEVSSVLRRATNELSEGGASLGPLVPRARLINVDGLMIAASEAGMRYGERWLEEVLAGVSVGCEGMTADVLPYCADDAFRQLLRVGVTAAPDYTPRKTRNDECQVQRVTFQLTAGLSYLFSRGEVCEATTLAAGASTCCLIETDEWPGDEVLKVELTNSTGSAVGPVDVTLTPTAGDSCPATGRPYSAFEVTGIEAGGVVSIDGRLEDVEAYDVLSRSTRSSIGLVSFEGVPRWPIVGPCMTACLCVTNSSDSPGAVDVIVTRYRREV